MKIGKKSGENYLIIDFLSNSINSIGALLCLSQNASIPHQTDLSENRKQKIYTGVCMFHTVFSFWSGFPDVGISNPIFQRILLIGHLI